MRSRRLSHPILPALAAVALAAFAFVASPAVESLPALAEVSPGVAAPGSARALSAGAVPASALSRTETQDDGEGEKLDVVHHQADTHYLDFSPFPMVELPRIFLVRRADGSIGLDVFGSTRSALEHGYVARFGSPEAADSSATPADSTGTPTGVEAAGIHLPAEADRAGTGEPGDHGSYLDAHVVPAAGRLILDLSVTKHLVFAWIGALLVLLIFLTAARRYRAGIGRDSAPRGLFQNLVESLVLFVRDDIVRPTLGAKSDRYLPYLLTAFFFILTCNLIGLVPFGATATSNIMVTAVLATFTFVITQFGGSRDYWKHILWPPGVPAFVKPILIPVEILGLFTKPFALAVRLFANMTAGHLVILSLIGLIFAFTDSMGAGAGIAVAPVAVAFSLFIYVLELLVAFIQAYVFTMLSALFIGMAVAEHEHHAPHDGQPLAVPAVVGDLTEIGGTVGTVIRTA